MTIEKVELHAMGFRAIVDLGTELLGPEQLDELLSALGATREQLADATAWFSLAFAESLLTSLAERSGNANFVEAAAERMLTPRYLGPIFPLYRSFGSPAFTYTRVLPLSQRTNKTGFFNVERLAAQKVRLTWTNYETTRERETHMCRLRIRQMQLAPRLFGGPEADVVHPKCALRGDRACVYDITWREVPRRLFSSAGMVAAACLASAGGWAADLSGLQIFGLATLGAVAGWASGRVLELRKAIVQHSADLTAHEQALTQIAQANERRYAELLEAKAEVDRKVEVRTQELQEATQRLSVTLSEIQALDRAKTDFFNNVSHELRSPLTLILAPLEDIIAGRKPPGGERTAFEAMQRNATRLLRLINQLLDLAKLDAGEAKIAPCPTDLKALAGAIIAGFEAAARKKGVRVELAAPDGLPVVNLDPSWIESAITNLVANALRLTPPGGHVRIIVEDHGADVAIVVADDGPGIAPEDQAKVFERFAQGDSSKRIVGGTGIGLALVREAARLHGGDVTLVSELGKGAAFTMRLPRRPLQHTDGAGGKTPSHRPTPQVMVDEFATETASSERAGPTNAPLALVVEDNPELREFIADVLAVRYRVRTANQGLAALSVARECRPDVIVSDVAMPEMNGYELCRALRAMDETRTTPILLVTARTEVASVLEGFEAGASDYVLKPFHGRELLARVDVHVRLRRMMQELALHERHAILGVLAASVAHQVRNPLTTLVSGLPAMRARLASKIDPSTRDLIDIMIECAGRVERLTGDLMDLSRVDREEGGEFLPTDGLRASIRLIKARLPDSVVIDERIEDAPTLFGRAGDMNHVFMNVLDNATKAVGPAGSIRVSATVAGERYLVRVEDSGPGIDSEMAQRIFEPFFTTRQAGEGTGLGLAIARQVMQKCGGSIGVGRSDLGGAAFVIEIPLTRRAMSPVPVRPVA